MQKDILMVKHKFYVKRHHPLRTVFALKGEILPRVPPAQCRKGPLHRFRRALPLMYPKQASNQTFSFLSLYPKGVVDQVIEQKSVLRINHFHGVEFPFECLLTMVLLICSDNISSFPGHSSKRPCLKGKATDFVDV